MKAKIITASVVIMLLVASCVPALASSRGTYYLRPNQDWCMIPTVMHDTAFSRFAVKCYAVYPVDGGTDNFHKVQCQVRGGEDEIITYDLYYVIDERTVGVTPIRIKEGCLDSIFLDPWLRGNADSEAYTDFEMYGWYNINNGTHD